MKTKLHNRVLSALLAVLMFMSCLPMFTFAELFPEGFVIAYEGEKTSAVTFYDNEKVTVTAENLPEGCTYQWQIQIPGTDVWVDIYGQTEPELGLSLALVGSLLDSSDSAYVRCVAVGGEPVYTDTLKVTVTEAPEIVVPAVPAAPAVTEPAPEITEPVPEITEETEATEAVEETPPELPEETVAPTGEATEETLAPVEPETVPEVTEETESVQETAAPTDAAEESFAPTEVETVPETAAAAEEIPEETAEAPAPMMLFAMPRSSDAVAPVAEETPEFVTVTILYERFDYADDDQTLVSKGEAFAPYVATIHYGQNLKPDKPVDFPKLVGYKTYLNGQEQTSLEIDLTNVTENVEYKVSYMPDKVQYQVRYFFQNIYDDLYVEDVTLAPAVTASRETSKNPDPQLIQKAVDGFSSLYYEPEKIAADGSTVFEVYYERNYYLMEFNCDGGYGAHTLYVRYGTYVSVPDPVKPGYSFNGWDLVKSEEKGHEVQSGDGVKNDLPATVPFYNSGYKAMWTEQGTTYTVTYWIKNATGPNTYVGSKRIPATSGETVSGSNDLTANTLICGYSDHTHTAACYTCDHTHTAACDPKNWTKNTPNEEWKWSAIRAIDAEPEDGYFYCLHRPDGKDYYVKFGETWYGWSMQLGGNEQLQGVLVESATITYQGVQYTAYKYRISGTLPNCTHNHDDDPLTCNAHTHTGECYAENFAYMEYVDADQNRTVNGDGSTVVNVYYQYKEYTLRFYYARTKGGEDSADDEDNIPDKNFEIIEIVGGSTWKFGASSSQDTADDEILLKEIDSWGRIKELPTLKNDKGYTKSAERYGDYYYHYISFSARYGDNIANKWPCAVFNSATRFNLDGQQNGWTKDQAVVSAWNGEYRVKYTQEHKGYEDNQTIKGRYEKLDDNLLFASQYEDVAVVSYLCFWENGSNSVNWNVPGLFRYNIYLETYAGQDLTGKTTVTRDKVDAKGNYVFDKYGNRIQVTYYLADSYDTCDNSSVGEQTQVAMEGFEARYYPQNYDSTKSYYQVKNSKPAKFYEYTEIEYNTDLFNKGYAVNFYYDRNVHKLNFMNMNGYMQDGEGEDFAYGASLKKFAASDNNKFMVEGYEYNGKTYGPFYPDSLEPGAYEFQGWFKDSFFSGERIKWENETMPDNDLTVYAKWVAKTHNVYFYYTYDDLLAGKTWDGYKDGNGNKVTYPIKVNHGEPLNTQHYQEPHEEDSIFLGWFYMDGTTKKRFNPDTMEVRSELKLFAEWKPKNAEDTQYTVTYVLQSDPTVEVADPTTGHISIGRTKTFTAKGGADLYEAYRAGYFPVVSSHSILMKNDPDHPNVFRFEYVQKEKVKYQVRYVDTVSKTELRNSVTKETGEAIVTERFLPITGYIPTSYYITQALVADEAQNIITFYYVENKTDAPYSVEYYQENLNSGLDWNNLSTDTDELSRYFTQKASSVGTATIGQAVTAELKVYEGFTHVAGLNTAVTYDDNGNPTAVMEQSLTQTVGKNGLTIRIYYRRQFFPYTVEYRKDGTGGDEGVLYTETGTAEFRQEITRTAPHSYTYDKTVYTLASAAEQSMTIRATDTNKLVFTYIPKKVEVFYHLVYRNSDLQDGCAVSLYKGKVAEVEDFQGSTAMPGAGFRFVGWYEDEACQKPVKSEWVDENNHLKPTELDNTVDVLNYYALFEPITLTISQTGIPTGETALYQITGNGVDLTVALTGKGSELASVTVEQIPAGEYTVTELTGWTWKNGADVNSQTVTVSKTAENKVSFAFTIPASNWLHGETFWTKLFDVFTPNQPEDEETT